MEIDYSIPLPRLAFQVFSKILTGHRHDFAPNIVDLFFAGKFRTNTISQVELRVMKAVLQANQDIPLDELFESRRLCQDQDMKDFLEEVWSSLAFWETCIYGG